MECSEEIRILLAGCVDDELSPVERQSVEEHLRTCQACRRLLAEQKAAVAAYAQYPVEPAASADFNAMWSRLESRLPQPAKRVSLDRLAEFEVGDEFADSEPQTAAAQAPKAPPAEPRQREKPRPEEQAPPQETRRAWRRTKPERLPVFKPLRFTRLKHTFWAHAAGIAASVLIAAMVLLSVKPVIRVQQFARADQVQISFPGDDPSSIPMVMSLPTDGDAGIPLVWIADIPEEPAGPEKGTIQ